MKVQMNIKGVVFETQVQMPLVTEKQKEFLKKNTELPLFVFNMETEQIELLK